MDETFDWELRGQIVAINKSLDEGQWHWAKQPSGSISLPDFIQLRAKGEAKMADGHVYLKKPGANPEIMVLLQQRIKDAELAMQTEITKKLYESSSLDDNFGLAKLFKDD
jgi:hypothetical protein